ncbi:hypothetical protein CALVIDRAFT_430977 [Calocera viscosa TUFC12733]|uniref:Uncharacterized protein n=1 Tax=Calocera viscosa (strain TUFC12733) TaxID=1330018 RepID=A0A167FZ42_CALVF|nr:hypothetical protein CALVIDRAFT_430977 [Calocera viscosa TUFC12733]
MSTSSFRGPASPSACTYPAYAYAIIPDSPCPLSDNLGRSAPSTCTHATPLLCPHSPSPASTLPPDCTMFPPRPLATYERAGRRVDVPRFPGAGADRAPGTGAFCEQAGCCWRRGTGEGERESAEGGEEGRVKRFAQFSQADGGRELARAVHEGEDRTVEYFRGGSRGRCRVTCRDRSGMGERPGEQRTDLGGRGWNGPRRRGRWRSWVPWDCLASKGERTSGEASEGESGEGKLSSP